MNNHPEPRTPLVAPAIPARIIVALEALDYCKAILNPSLRRASGSSRGQNRPFTEDQPSTAHLRSLETAAISSIRSWLINGFGDSPNCRVMGSLALKSDPPGPIRGPWFDLDAREDVER